MEITFSEQEKTQLQSLGVVALYLFGSRAQGTDGPLSDFDFAVLMDRDGYARGGEAYQKLYDLLSPHCERTLQNDVIDIIFLRDVGLELRHHVVRYGRVIYDAEPLSRGRFEARTMTEYCDFRPLLKSIDRAILASV